jgi:predicted Zn-dependent protease
VRAAGEGRFRSVAPRLISPRAARVGGRITALPAVARGAQPAKPPWHDGALPSSSSWSHPSVNASYATCLACSWQLERQMSRSGPVRALPVSVVAIVALLLATPAQADSFRWPQPNGPGSQAVLTYSYNNLFLTDFDGLSVNSLRAATEQALSLWSLYVPLMFIERSDSGPTAADIWYDAGNYPDIRIGAHDGFGDSELAHAYLPVLTDSSGLAGDVHFNDDPAILWSLGARAPGIDFLEVMTHEIGHALGLPHAYSPDAIMYPFHEYRFHGLGTGYLLPRDIRAIQSLYGAGSGSVVPTPELPTLVLVSTAGLVWAVARRRSPRRRHLAEARACITRDLQHRGRIFRRVWLDRSSPPNPASAPRAIRTGREARPASTTST